MRKRKFMGSKKINPPRRKTREQVRSDYYKQLATKQVSGTVEATTIEEPNGTDKIPDIKQGATSPPAQEPAFPSQKLSDTKTILSIIGGIITILIFIATVVYYFTSLKESLNHTNSNLKELKETTNERINRLDERIDKYISKEKSK